MSFGLLRQNLLGRWFGGSLKLSAPMLMLPLLWRGSEMVYNFYSPADRSEVTLKTRGGEEGKHTKVVGSSHGWLALFNSRTRAVSLSNPLSGRRVELPPLEAEPWKVILSHQPDEEECRAVMIPNGARDWAAFCCPARRRSTQWAPFAGKEIGSYNDFAYSPARGCLVGFSQTDEGGGNIEYWDIDSTFRARMDWLQRFVRLERAPNSTWTKYIVPTEDSLFVVKRYDFFDRPSHLNFYVYRIEADGGERYLYSLGNMAIFVGLNHSFVVDVSRFPGLKPNAIYYSGGAAGVGVYNYRTRETSPLPLPLPANASSSSLPWFTPRC